MLYQFTIYPIECIYKVLYLFLYHILQSYGLALIGLSIATTVIMRPFMKWAVTIQRQEKKLQKIMRPQLERINSEFHGVERHQKIQRLYKRYAYHPVFAVRSAIGILLQVPFLIAAYYMLSNLIDIQGQHFLFIQDISLPDGLFFGFINIFPVIMLCVNLFSAWTTPGFSSRDFGQAAIIAGAFFVLLYKAPTALLIYWTCNNLWTLFGNIGGEYLTPKLEKTAFVHDLTRYYRKLKISDAGYIFSAFALTLYILVPMDIYITNINELWFSFSEILKYLLIMFVVTTSILIVMYRSIKNTYFQYALLVLTLGLLLGIFAQSYLLHVDYGKLDGHAIDWSQYRIIARWNTAAWLACLGLPILFAWQVSQKILLQTGKYIAIFLVVAQIGSTSYVLANTYTDKQYKNFVTKDHMLEISKHDNIIVFVLDSFDTKVFQQIQKNDSADLDDLDGFTYYPDATSLFGFTSYSMPQMLTGRAYDNSKPFSEYIQSAWKENEFYPSLKKENYDIDIYTLESYLPSGSYIDNVESGKLQISSNIFEKFCDLVLFRVVPHYMKKNHLIYSGDLLHQKDAEEGFRQYDDANLAFYQEIQKGLTFQDETNSFRWYHLDGDHFPFKHDRNLNPIPENTGNVYEQGIGALKIVYEYLRQMKQANVYDDATILILADHGVHHAIGHSPLLLVKQPGDKGKLKTSKNAVSYIDLQATLLSRYLGKSSSLGEDFSYSNHQQRTFYMLDDRSGIPLLIRYLISPDASEPMHWIKDITLKYEGFQKLVNYRIGEKITSASGERGERYRTFGWSILAHDYVLGKGDSSILALQINKAMINADLCLSVTFTRGTEPDFDRSRRVAVLVNDEYIGEWTVEPKLQTYQMIVPKNVVLSNEGNMKIEMHTIEPHLEPYNTSFGMVDFSIDLENE